MELFVGGFASDVVEGDTIKYLRRITDEDYQVGVEVVTGEITYVQPRYTAIGTELNFRIKLDAHNTESFGVDDQFKLEIAFPFAEEFRRDTRYQHNLAYSGAKRLYRRWHNAYKVGRNRRLMEKLITKMADEPSFSGLNFTPQQNIEKARVEVTRMLLDGTIQFNTKGGYHLHYVGLELTCEFCQSASITKES